MMRYDLRGHELIVSHLKQLGSSMRSRFVYYEDDPDEIGFSAYEIPAFLLQVGTHMARGMESFEDIENLDRWPTVQNLITELEEWHRLAKQYSKEIEEKVTAEALAELPEDLQRRTVWLREEVQKVLTLTEPFMDMANELRGETTVTKTSPSGKPKVFIVHGHDEGAKEAVARQIEKLGLEAVILHERPSKGSRSLIEKFEEYASVDFAVVLLTPDDVGGMANKPQELRPRARQNVIFELGYFLGKLGRDRVCALYKSGVDIPTDYHGVMYIEMDSRSAWKAELVRELVAVGLVNR